MGAARRPASQGLAVASGGVLATPTLTPSAHPRLILEIARCLGFLALAGLAWVALAIVVAGCTVRWQELPRYADPGVRVYAVELRWGTAAFEEPPIWATGCGSVAAIRSCP